MEIEEYGRARILKPSFEDDDLSAVDELDGAGSLTDFEYADRSVRHLIVADTTLSGGRLRQIEAERVTFGQVTLQSIVIDRCVLMSSDWMDCALSRVLFRDCKILGANFVDNKWSNVVFENCRIEYATFDSIRASTPVVFVDSRFKEVRFQRSELPGGHMSGCTLDAVEFDGGTYTDFDFRHTDLSAIRGAGNLNGILIDVIQRQELAEALVSELDLRYAEEADG
ncbi:pentapeptide repeat-containing protein [Kribbella sp.]|uniref:pentapeptide repeat-containing protein n=1 Tax=Kribbella sp. TaxID=1871183 RepID=UPI002D3D74D7|nr:pentapeptide repeat-containing protein [Kribbella sp.]HZX08040.1 pentapeptide repeat-containing protein [Kribbella sp.]